MLSITTPSPSGPMTLDQFPEELLDRILALSITPAPARPLWHRAPSTLIAPLLTSRRFLRIATPLFYHSIHLSCRKQSASLLATLQTEPILATYVRNLTVGGVWPEVGRIMALCNATVRVLDLTLDNVPVEPVDENRDRDEDTISFCQGLQALTGVRHLVLRKPNNVYLSVPRPRYVIAGLAKAIEGWHELETANITFKLSDDTPSSPTQDFPGPQPFSTNHNLVSGAPSFSTMSPIDPIHVAPPSTTPSVDLRNPRNPITLLTSALRLAPKLHTFSTHLPSVWNIAILSVSANPRLERIVLADGRRTCASGYRSSVIQRDTGFGQATQAIIGTGLFLMEARKHKRLGELIRAGTPIIRTRAHTLGTVGLPPSPGLNGSPASVCAGPLESPTKAGL